MKKFLSMIVIMLLLAGCSGKADSKSAKKLDLAVKYLSEGKFEEAILEYNEVLKIDSKNLLAYKGLGKVYTLQGNYGEAEKVYQAGLNQVADKKQLQLSLAGLYIDQRKNDFAEKLYDELITLDKTYVPAYEGLARALITRGEMDEAISKLRQCVEANSGNERSYSLLAEAYLQKGDREQSLSLTAQSLKINPNQYAAYRLMEQLYNKDWTKIADFGSSLLGSDEIAGRTLRIYSYYNDGQYPEAVDEYLGLPDKGERSYKAAAVAALAYLKNGDGKSADKLIDEINLKETKNPFLFADVARYYLEKGDLKQARKIALEGIGLDDNCIENYLVLIELAKKDNSMDTSFYNYLLLTKNTGPVRSLEMELKERGSEVKFLVNEETVTTTNEKKIETKDETTAVPKDESISANNNQPGTVRYDMRDLEKRLINSGYLYTLYGAFWVVDQGEPVVPYLETLLANQQRYAEEKGAVVGAFPFNVVWALAQIGGEDAERILKKQYDYPLALEAVNLRKSNPNLKVMMDDHPLYKNASYSSEQLDLIGAGESIIVLKERIVNEKEMGGRGGPAEFDFIEVPNKNIKGYIQRAGDSFPPYY